MKHCEAATLHTVPPCCYIMLYNFVGSFPSDGNCIHMVDTGIVQMLLDLLDRHVEEGNVTVQHAALSALRNLAIPGQC